MPLYKIVGHQNYQTADEIHRNKIYLIRELRTICSNGFFMMGLIEGRDHINNIINNGYTNIDLSYDNSLQLRANGFILNSIDDDDVQQTEIVTFFTMYENLGKYIQHLVSMNAPEVLQAMVITFNALQKKVNR